MIFHKTPLKDAHIIELEPIRDKRGFFARSFCQKEFRSHGLDMNTVQCNVSYNKHKGTLRGMHYQAAPYEEAKLVSCIKGAIHDVIIDLRPDSETYCQWTSVVLGSPGSQSRVDGTDVSAGRSPLTAHSGDPSSDCLLLTAYYSMLYVPKGFAHGFLTLEDDTEVFYQMSEFYAPGYGRGIRWNDPTFRIDWPEEVEVISERDRNYPDFKE